MIYYFCSILFCILLACQTFGPEGIPPGFRLHSVPRIKETRAEAGTIQHVTQKLAAEVANYRYWMEGNVTKVSRGSFRSDIGTAEGILPGQEAEVLRLTDSGVITVARASVKEAGDGFSTLRRIDRGRSLRIRKDDKVRIASHVRLIMGGIGGVPREIGDLLRSRILILLRGEHGLSVIESPNLRTATRWSSDETIELCKAALDNGCTHALAGWAEARGDTIHLAIGLVEASSQTTVDMYSGTIDSDPALAAVVASGVLETSNEDVHGSERPSDMPGGFSSYETGLAEEVPGLDLKGEVLAARLVERCKCICLVRDESIDVYEIDPREAPRYSRSYEIGPPPEPVLCRDGIATVALLDSNGDGTEELVIWSSRLSGPAAFSLQGGDGDGRLVGSRAEVFWLPWADPLGDGRYRAGMNHMTAPAVLGKTPYYTWKTADLTGDGAPEVVLAELDGSVTVRDTSMAVISTIPGAGSAIEIFDMNGDGLMELIVPMQETRGGPTQVVFFNWTGGDFEEVWRYGSYSWQVQSLSAGFVNKDDMPDLAVLSRDAPRAGGGRLSFLVSSRLRSK